MAVATLALGLIAAMTAAVLATLMGAGPASVLAIYGAGGIAGTLSAALAIDRHRAG